MKKTLLTTLVATLSLVADTSLGTPIHAGDISTPHYQTERIKPPKSKPKINHPSFKKRRHQFKKHHRRHHRHPRHRTHIRQYAPPTTYHQPSQEIIVYGDYYAYPACETRYYRHPQHYTRHHRHRSPRNNGYITYRRFPKSSSPKHGRLHHGSIHP